VVAGGGGRRKERRAEEKPHDVVHGSTTPHTFTRLLLGSAARLLGRKEANISGRLRRSRQEEKERGGEGGKKRKGSLFILSQQKRSFMTHARKIRGSSAAAPVYA